MMTGKKDIQLIISGILRAGVFGAVGIAIIGGIIYLAKHGHEPVHYDVFNGAKVYESPQYVFDHLLHFRGRAVIQGGILLLILTPIVRVIFSAISFVIEKDYLYTGITLLVLGIIIFSMLFGVGH